MTVAADQGLDLEHLVDDVLETGTGAEPAAADTTQQAAAKAPADDQPTAADAGAATPQPAEGAGDAPAEPAADASGEAKKLRQQFQQELANARRDFQKATETMQQQFAAALEAGKPKPPDPLEEAERELAELEKLAEDPKFDPYDKDFVKRQMAAHRKVAAAIRTARQPSQPAGGGKSASQQAAEEQQRWDDFLKEHEGIDRSSAEQLWKTSLARARAAYPTASEEAVLLLADDTWTRSVKAYCARKAAAGDGGRTAPANGAPATPGTGGRMTPTAPVRQPAARASLDERVARGDFHLADEATGVL